MDNFVKGYEDDAGLDIVLDDILVLEPGLNNIDLPCHYTPAKGEVAFLVPRSSTAKLGIFPIMVAIDTGYTGIIHGMVINMSDRRQVFDKGDRVFGIVNLLRGEDRATDYKISKPGRRGDNWNASSGYSGGGMQ